MGEEYGVHVLQADTGRPQFRGQPPIHAADEVANRTRIGGHAPAAGVHKDGAALGADEIAVEVDAQVFRAGKPLGVSLLVRSPGLGGNVGEGHAQGQRALVIVNRDNLDVSHSKSICGHGEPPQTRVRPTLMGR